MKERSEYPERNSERSKPNTERENLSMSDSTNSTTSPWLPIESAPLDGTEILAARKFKGTRTWERVSVYFVECERQWFGVGIDEQVYEPEVPFTHWMPLPQPPAQEATQ